MENSETATPSPLTANPAPAPAPPTTNPTPAPPTANPTPAPPTANPAPAPLTANLASIANSFRFLLYATIPLSVLIAILHCSGYIHPTNPFALPRAFNFMAPAPEPMVSMLEPTASPPGDDFTAPVLHELFVPPVLEPTASPPISHELYVRPTVYDFTPSAESYNPTARKIRPGRSKHPPATRNKIGECPTQPAKNKTSESPTLPGESPTSITLAPHTTPKAGFGVVRIGSGT
ncbi:hypothetical protein RHSIM_Rhsim11G0183300 [Rhododendron simsii]|uniref:Uncharacterized protein n=1 Tax=Rhododendron simsii TaxID=118357 RepID=A0A834LA87_RHOSS|nr:hypothetical protein RHSIM_Rhsim11G0183300 [Rhododendron simsii]